MNPERFRRLEELYDAAAALDPLERNRFIAEQCSADEELRRELLAAFESSSTGLTGLIENAAAEAVESDDNWNGRRFGPYRIRRPLGRGGMGAVYLAVRDDDEFHKEVAIKTLKFELEGGTAVTRFRYERQILAHLEHPNIARLLDGGTTEHGTPYIVLEYVVGIPIGDWCEQKQLSIEQRLQLFRQVCDAVQYAHQHLIVHRDIKPGNILVTQDGVPKLLDFGIAKLLDASVMAGIVSPAATITGALLMTPDYASPEQVRGDGVSTVTDVYSLGAVLYELLSGQRPYSLHNYDAVEIARVVCESEIRAPSTLGNRQLRGDLDNIVLKAMQKDASRRYSSVAELSEDIRRHLVGLPVIARADTSIYRAIKFVRRHRLGVAATATVIAALAIGVAASLHEARVAQRRFTQVRELANTFLFQFYDQVTPLAGSTAVRASIVETARKYLDGLSQEAGNDKDLILELAQAYQRLGNVQGRTGSANLGQLDDARRSYRRALDLYASLPANVQATADARRRVANVLLASGRLEYDAYHEDAAEPFIQRMLDLTAGPNPEPATRLLNAIAVRSMGDIRLRQGRATEALTMLETARHSLIEMQSSDSGDPDLATEISVSQEHLGRAKVYAGDLDGALAVFMELLKNSAPCDEQAAPGNACELLAVRLSWTGDVYAATDRPNLNEPVKAAEMYEQALHIAERIAALDAHNRQAQFNLAARYGKLGDAIWPTDPKRALDLYEHALSTAKALVSREQLEIFHDAYLIAITRPLIRLGRTAEARKALTESLAVAKTDSNSPYADRIGEIAVREILPGLLLAEGKRTEARQALMDLIRDTEALRANHPEDLTPVCYLADAYRLLASISTGEPRREALLHSAAAWHSWPATSFTTREEKKDMIAAAHSASVKRIGSRSNFLDITSAR